MKIHLIHSVFMIIFAAVPVVAQPADEPAQDDNKVTIRDRTYEIYPPELLEARGLEVPDIPREENAAFVYIEASRVHVNQPPWDNGWRDAYEAALLGQWPEGEQGEKIAAWLEQNRPCFELIERASLMDQYYMPLLKGDTDAFLATLLPMLPPTRELAKNMVVYSTYLDAQGRADEAMDVLLTVQRMGHHVGNGQTIIEGLVGIAVDAISSRNISKLAESGRVSAEKLKEVTAAMEEQAKDSFKFDRMLEMERLWAESYVDDAIDGGGLLLNPNLLPASPNPSPWERLGRRIKRLYLPDRVMKQHIKAHYDAIETAARRDNGVPGEMIDEAELFAQVPQWDVVSRIVLPSLSRAYELTLRSESNSTRARLSTAVAAYKQERGEYPDALTALVPEYVSRVPIDPMTGYEFDYKVEGDKPAGLEPIGKENIEKLVEKRKQPAILNPRASRWRRYVEDFCERYDLTPQQRAAADAILRNMEGQAYSFERAHGAKLQELIEAGETERAKKNMGPLDQMYEQLKKRLEAIPTAAQRTAAGKKAEGKKTKMNSTR